ncbi:PA14 domain-containing protein [Roseobacter litoralis]|uniref:PA14 domain-containing protein n=1 Tax=Roseobacter litoralis TaxID=42443 RepID=UPI00249406A3|nr:PA14 domain-containing protein [Roseobacter litoralis]
MKQDLIAAALSLAVLSPVAAVAQEVTLAPADPQPKASALAPGLAVNYATIPSNVRSIDLARKSLERRSEPGAPIAGLSLEDTKGGDKVLTSERAEQVAADISGFIKFGAAGTYTLDFLSNDGLQIAIGGQEVGFYDGVHPCGYVGEIEVAVPQAGYYALEATYFQRKGTACLMMEIGPDSDGLELASDDIFFHLP